MLLAELVAAAGAVAATPSRNAKVAALAGLLGRSPLEEVAAAVCLLSGEPRQGRIGVGWATIAGLDAAPAAAPTLTVGDLDAALSRVQATVGPGSASARSAVLGGLLRRATPAEADFVRRLLVGELRQGALEGVTTEAVARAAGVPAALVRRALMLGGDLGEAARIALAEGAGGLAAVRLAVLRPVRPMLASTAEDPAGALAATGPASVEWKVDGVRIQVHRLGSEVRIFTRNLNDVTARLPEVVAVARELPADSLILDGEAVGVDEEGLPHLFQDTMSRVGRRGGEAALPISPYFFDCLHAAGEDLIDRPLAERLEALGRVAGRWCIPAIRTSEPEEAGRFLEGALAAGHEGVMVKATASAYQAGRRGRAWVKVKAARTLDLVVLGAEWGNGRRRGWLSNLHLGARDPGGRFVMVGKTFKGLTDALLRWQTARLLELETGRQGIAVFVRPELVVEIELDGVQASPRYPGGVALRFARVRRYRPDRDASDADTIGAVRALLGRER